jgi:hypothetical protein
MGLKSKKPPLLFRDMPDKSKARGLKGRYTSMVFSAKSPCQSPPVILQPVMNTAKKLGPQGDMVVCGDGMVVVEPFHGCGCRRAWWYPAGVDGQRSAGARVCRSEIHAQVAPHTREPRDVPRCGALSLLQKPPQYRGGKHNSWQPLCSGPLPSCCSRPRFGSRG